MDDPKAAGREFSPWLAAYYGTTWPGITALLAGRDGYLQFYLNNAMSRGKLTMFEEKLHISLTKCFRGLCTDPTDAVIISGWYCIAQWVVNFDLRRPFTRELFEECLGNHSFRDWLRVCLLAHYAIDETAELLYQLCRIINRVNLTHSNAKMFYAHYLPCVIADMSFLHAFPTRIATMGHISCTLIHLAMTYAQERLGSSDIFSMPAQTVREPLNK